MKSRPIWKEKTKEFRTERYSVTLLRSLVSRESFPASYLLPFLNICLSFSLFSSSLSYLDINNLVGSSLMARYKLHATPPRSLYRVQLFSFTMAAISLYESNSTHTHTHIYILKKRVHVYVALISRDWYSVELARVLVRFEIGNSSLLCVSCTVKTRVKRKNKKNWNERLENIARVYKHSVYATWYSFLPGSKRKLLNDYSRPLMCVGPSTKLGYTRNKLQKCILCT